MIYLVLEEEGEYVVFSFRMKVDNFLVISVRLILVLRGEIQT